MDRPRPLVIPSHSERSASKQPGRKGSSRLVVEHPRLCIQNRHDLQPTLSLILVSIVETKVSASSGVMQIDLNIPPFFRIITILPNTLLANHKPEKIASS